jgi:NTP pyrophosphatase (non-canonical NTP hydrolase)
MNYNELSKAAHKDAVNHGFWSKRESNEHYMMLVVAEIGEMVEAHRNGKHANLEAYNEPLLGGCAPFTSFIKDTIEDEMADIAIWLADISVSLGVDFDKMNPCKYHRAFDRFTFTENAFALTKGLCRDIIGIEKRIQFGLEYVSKWAKSINIDLDWHIDEKMKYNATRPPKHGKAY